MDDIGFFHLGHYGVKINLMSSNVNKMCFLAFFIFKCSNFWDGKILAILYLPLRTDTFLPQGSRLKSVYPFLRSDVFSLKSVLLCNCYAKVSRPKWDE